MKIVTFARQKNEMWETVKAHFPKDSIELCTTLSSFAVKLFEFRFDETIAVLLPANEEELIDMYSVQNLFDGIPIMVVLPDRNNLTEAIGYRLKPRFVCYSENSATESISMLGNMVKNSLIGPRK
ncbi:MAG: hypothetical protein A4E63_00162 [Syntrophorhabdus sp. PtaU1.Bin050]|nr:MAG: hypothetical protein A4E63_00162 [Syntrophorhabdus sp. PtaU1.Bin050]